MDVRCGPSPGFVARELGPDAGAGPGRHRLPASLFTPEYDAQTKGEGRGVPQGLHRRGYSPERSGTSPPTLHRFAPPVFLWSYPSLCDNRRGWPSAAAHSPQPAHLLFSGWGGDHRAGSLGCGPRWGGGQTGSGPAGTLLLPPQRRQTKQRGPGRSALRLATGNFKIWLGLPRGPATPRAACLSQSAPGQPFFKPSSGRQSGSSRTFLS